MKSISFVTIVSAIGVVSQASAAEVTRPKLLNLEEVFTADDYPLSAQDNEIEGTARVDVTVGSDGLVISCKITESSGSAVLDEQSCALFRSRARFEAARDRRGRPVKGHYRRPVSWRLEDDSESLLPRQANFMRSIIDFNNDGRIVACSTEAFGVETKPDPCELVTKSLHEEPLRNGEKAVAVRSIVEAQFVPVEYGKAVLPPLRTDASLFAREVFRLEADGEGVITACELVASEGKGTATPDFCSRANRFEADPDHKVLKGTLIVTAYSQKQSLS